MATADSTVLAVPDLILPPVKVEHVRLQPLPFLFPEKDRPDELHLLYGLTIAEMLPLAFPGATPQQLANARVYFNGEIVLPELWPVAKPKTGNQIAIRLLPGKGGLAAILGIVISIVSLGVGALIGGTIGALVGGLIKAGLGLLLNALVPVSQPKEEKQRPRYSIQGFRNELIQGGPVPSILGRHRVAPTFAAAPWTEVIVQRGHDDAVSYDQYLHAIFNLGYGEVAYSDLKIGDTPLAKFKNYTIVGRIGRASDRPFGTIYDHQVIEEAMSVHLKFDTAFRLTGIGQGDYAHTSSSNYIGDEETRFTASDASAFSVDFNFPQGLVHHSKSSDNVDNIPVYLRIRYRLNGEGDWIKPDAIGDIPPDMHLDPDDGNATPYANVQIIAKEEQQFVVSFRYEFPARGRYEIGITRISKEVHNLRNRASCDWVTLRSERPEYPLNFIEPLAQIAIKIKASHQLNGTLDNFNLVLSRVCKDWDADTETWIARETQNPASLFRYVLQSPAAAYPRTDAQIDLVALQEWHEYCEDKGLTYNFWHDRESSQYDVLTDIARAGRALPHDTGTKWTVIIDRPRDTPSAHIGTRNSFDCEISKETVRFPDAFRASFYDETNNYEQAERIVEWPGFVGAPETFISLDLPGYTNPDQVYLELRRRQYEMIYRGERAHLVQDWESMISARGDLVQLNRDELVRTMQSGRVKAVSGNTLTVDTECLFEAGKTYQVQFRKLPSSEAVMGDPPFVSITRSVTASAGNRTIMTMAAGTAPNVDDLFFFGETNLVSEEWIIQNIERGDNLTARLTLLPAAANIEDLLDETEVPEWSSRVGDDLIDGTAVPPAPDLVTIVSGEAAEGEDGEDRVLVFVTPGDVGEDQAIPATWEARHRISGGGAWSTSSAPTTLGYVPITSYSNGDIIQVQARAVSTNGFASAWVAATPPTHVVHGDDPVIPKPTLNKSITTAPRVTINWTNANDINIAGARVYRAASGAGFAAATDISGLRPGYANHPMSYRDAPPRGLYDYFVTLENEKGTKSEPLGPIAATVAATDASSTLITADSDIHTADEAIETDASSTAFTVDSDLITADETL